MRCGRRDRTPYRSPHSADCESCDRRSKARARTDRARGARVWTTDSGARHRVELHGPGLVHIDTQVRGARRNPQVRVLVASPGMDDSLTLECPADPAPSVVQIDTDAICGTGELPRLNQFDGPNSGGQDNPNGLVAVTVDDPRVRLFHLGVECDAPTERRVSKPPAVSRPARVSASRSARPARGRSRPALRRSLAGSSLEGDSCDRAGFAGDSARLLAHWLSVRRISGAPRITRPCFSACCRATLHRALWNQSSGPQTPNDPGSESG